MEFEKQYALFLLLLSGYSAFGMRSDFQFLEEQQRIGLVNHELLDAVRTNNLNRVKEFIRLGADLNRNDEGLNIVLAEAINTIKPNSTASNVKANLKLLHVLVFYGAIVEPDDLVDLGVAMAIDNNQLIRAAAFFGLQDVIKILYGLGGNINQPSPENKNTPLHVALVRGYTNAVDVLIALGADKQAKNKYGYTPFDHVIGGNGLLKMPQRDFSQFKIPEFFDRDKIAA
jgi:hypothetical protein